MLNIQTSRSEQTVQTQIKLLLHEQFDQGLHCLPFYQYFLDTSKSSQTDLVKVLWIMLQSKYTQKQ